MQQIVKREVFHEQIQLDLNCKLKFETLVGSLLALSVSLAGGLVNGALVETTLGGGGGRGVAGARVGRLQNKK